MDWFPHIVARRAQAQPDRLAYRFQQGSTDPQTLTCAALWQEAATLADRMAREGWRGQCVLLVCRQERSFVVAFYACLIAGVIAVPTAPPRRQLLHERLRLLVHEARVKAIVCDFDEIMQTGFQNGDNGLAVLDLRSVASDPTVAFAIPRIDGDTPAFLQYTSGSTGDPKGVVVTHANLVHNSECIRASMGMSAASSVLVGLPLFHDMGLVGGVLQSMYVGCTATFLPPAELVQYPERWLHLISTLRITTSGGPNFMFSLAADEVPEEALDGLDLSCWQVAFCGAEPIRAATVDRFSRRFAATGFRPSAFYPCYGMAEATLFITGGQVGGGVDVMHRDGTDVVCCGEPSADMRLRIVDPETRTVVEEGAIGEIWVAGNSVAQGYWGREALTDAVFHAQLVGEGDGDWLRTGDLGWLQAGRLYVSGRLKDLIIANGRKYAPQDLEAAVESVGPAVRRGGVAAFAIPGAAGENAVVVVELEREWFRRKQEWPALVAAARAAVHAAQGVRVADVVFIRPGALSRTSSGKVRRAQCRSDYLDGRFHSLSADVGA